MPNKIFVCNIPYSMNSLNLTSLFSVYGKVNYAISVKDKNTGVPKGFGFVDMDTPEGKLAAIGALNGREIAGRKIQVSEAIDRTNIEQRPRAKIQGTGVCLICGKERILAGFSRQEGICAACAKIISNVHFHYGRASMYAEEGEEEEPIIECILEENTPQ